ncbi:uncharacterized protein A1O9_02671 [Exophiala aquamarina CBS 119918]|uniref:FAD dependent oxidoreductase domain-containing protein n=1 Tax=Exophiala aquamarina CBS 119918 TaxID=1182545 RepID=A0A072PMJ8_9EURO|nr:uncharacterized protein A1O9_02671 [Exophiala aquamarina CBS 119918]KEF61106.1 hypothetical protein A1O9_02671 [Exophiala aquamarina CBS 119918]
MTEPPPKKRIVIIGGGIIGCTTAYFLTRHLQYDRSLHTIHLIEATDIASGASGKAGGLLALWAYPACLVPLSFKLHGDLAREHDGAERWGYRGVGVGQIELVGRKVGERQMKAAGDGCGDDIRGIHRSDVASDGNLELDAARVSLQKRSAESYARLRNAGLPDDLDWVAEESVRAYDSMGSPEDTAQVHPYQFTTSMARLAEEKGVKVILGSVDEIVDHDSSSPGSEALHTVKYTDKETRTSHSLSATDVIVTAGPWTKSILPSAPIGALRAHSVTIRPSRPVSAYCLFTQISLPKDYKAGTKSRATTVTPEIYARPKGEVYACGEGDHLVPLPKSAAEVVVDGSRCQDIVDYCASFSDEMRDGEVTARQACYLPQVERGAGPLVGLTPRKGVYLAAGHTCWGIQNGPATGKIMSEFVFDGRSVSADVGSLNPRRVLR